ncbi:DUF6484 domain-containing protein [Archangium sp.]|uniref:DUF6484 domain-containing protein n=1 Tax=Archangium sp. TaxID=1872627 RepID=UPI002D592914|nr:DUF6484 domain-containing protein [Archangium sp.]HYO53959.1 DUF6484 domain-containing protein [Archangium sp.]
MTSPMNPSAARAPEAREQQEPIWGTRLGWLVGSDAEGHFLVDYDGNRAGPLVARRTITLEPQELRDAIAARRKAVLLFENGDPRLPLVVGMEQVRSATPLTDAVLEASLPAPAPQEPVEAHVDGKRVVIEGKDEIVLQCGQASITLRRNGKVVIKGTYVESHASGTQRIKGGSVQIN